MIALDIDGTIRSDDSPLRDSMQRTIARVVDAGAMVTIATGRMFHSAMRLTAELNLKSPIASFQGAEVRDPVTGQVLWHRPLTHDMLKAAVDALEPWGLEVVAYHEDEVYVTDLTPRIDRYGDRNRVVVNVVDDLKVSGPAEPTRLVVVGGDDEIRRLESELKTRFDSELYVTRSLSYFCEILHPEGGKHKALAWLCEQTGVSQEETVAFGNGYNDVEMLQWAGLGVAVAGAVPEALSVADRIAPPVEEDGVTQVLQCLLDAGMIG